MSLHRHTSEAATQSFGTILRPSVSLTISIRAEAFCLVIVNNQYEPTEQSQVLKSSDVSLSATVMLHSLCYNVGSESNNACTLKAKIDVGWMHGENITLKYKCLHWAQHLSSFHNL